MMGVASREKLGGGVTDTEGTVGGIWEVSSHEVPSSDGKWGLRGFGLVPLYSCQSKKITPVSKSLPHNTQLLGPEDTR